MTETGHGSDVQQLRTTCTYDPETQTFDLHTPHQAARKDYIGNAAKDGRMAVVFAQLVTGGPASRRRTTACTPGSCRSATPTATPCPGVTIEDDGAKAGLNGVDNGRLTFDHVPVPARGAARPLRPGRRGRHLHLSSIENETRRFFTMLGTLVRGRVSVGGVRGARPPSWRSTSPSATATCAASSPPPATTARSSSTTTSCTSASCCPRWPPPTRCTSRRSELVGTMHDVQTAVHEHGQEIDEAAQRELESRAAGLKVAQTWHATRTIQMCREACGGAGYLQENRLPQLKADTDVFTTFEGDNTVLLQLVAKGLLTGYRDAFGSLDGWGKVGFVADMVRETVLERTAARALIAPAGRRRPRPGRRRAAARPRLAAEDVRVPREAHARGRDPAAAPNADDRRAWRRSTCSTTSRTTC